MAATLNAQQERLLHARIRSGEQEALDELIVANLGLALSAARRYARREGLAALEEIQSDNFLALLRAAGSFDPDRGRFSTWAYQWFRHQRTCRLDAKQRRTRERSLIGSEETGGVISAVEVAPDRQLEPSDLVHLGEQDQMVAAAVEGLDPRLRRVVQSYFWDRKTLRELAAERGLSKEGVRQHLKKAKTVLRRVLQPVAAN